MARRPKVLHDFVPVTVLRLYFVARKFGVISAEGQVPSVPDELEKDSRSSIENVPVIANRKRPRGMHLRKGTLHDILEGSALMLERLSRYVIAGEG